MHRLLHTVGLESIKVSAASCRLKFISCGPECISRGCTAKCCDAPTSPTGIRVHVGQGERSAIEAKGVSVDDNGFIVPFEGERLCPFKTPGHLCGLFGDPARPFGCWVSPFMLNKHGTMVIRNRYKLLPCYDKVSGQPAYVVFRSSLLAALGHENTVRLSSHLDKGGGDLRMMIESSRYKLLTEREEALHAD